MKNLKKMFMVAIIGIISVGSFSISTYAAELNNQSVEVELSEKSSADGRNILRKDNIIRKYRVHNGVLQYRRWNTTYGVWVDPDWINLS